MKGLHLVLLSFYLITVLAHHERYRCGKNEVFDECGSACEPTCRNPNPEICTLQCVPGCRCKTGFFRNDRNECVSDCSPPYTTRPPTPASCSELRCPTGTHCEMVEVPCTRHPCATPSPKCVQDRPPTTTPRHSSPASCSHMLCPEGTRCVMVKQPCKYQPCPAPIPKCIAASTPAYSTTPSPPLPPTSCDQIQCPPGFSCELISVPCREPPCSPPVAQCFREQAQPITCPKNESWRNCSSRCEPTCDNRYPRCNDECGEPKCQCHRGLVRSRSGECIRPSECPRHHMYDKKISEED